MASSLVMGIKRISKNLFASIVAKKSPYENWFFPINGRRVEFARKPDGAPIEHEGQLWIVRDDAIVLEPESICFPWPQGRIEITERRAGTRDLFEPLLNDFQNGHDCTRARL
jgi:hypothetical protein